MIDMESIVATIALMMGVSWASGINLYAAILTLGLLGSSGHMVLPPELHILTDPIVIGAAALMYCVEFFADKIPGVDVVWDSIHTFIRIPAGAVLAAQVIGDVSPSAEIAAALLGGTLAAGSHFTKAGTRILINASPEPFSNWTASFVEDVAVIAGVWAAVQHPWVFLAALVLFIALVIWALPKIWRGIKALLRAIGRLLGGRKPEPLSLPPAPQI
jgi:hypothetical protein